MTTESQKAFEEWEELYWQDKKKYATARMAWLASRQHIIDKLQSEEMVERVSAALFEYGSKDYCAMKAKAAIAAVLEGI